MLKLKAKIVELKENLKIDETNIDKNWSDLIEIY